MVVIGNAGTISLDALRWCDGLGVPLIVIDPHDGRPTFASIPGGDDARLRRAQARAPESGIGLDIARLLLGAKLGAQATLLRDRFGDVAAADTVDSLAEAIDVAETIEECRQCTTTAQSAPPGRLWGGRREDMGRVKQLGVAQSTHGAGLGIGT